MGEMRNKRFVIVITLIVLAAISLFPALTTWLPTILGY